MTITKSKLLFVVILVSMQTTFSQNKYNLNFDDFDSQKSKMPMGWFKWGFHENLTGETFNDGNTVGKVVSDKKGRFGCITYRIPANYIGDTIRLTGRMKLENIKEYAGLLMRIDGDSKKRSLAFKTMQGLKIKGTRDWKEYSIALPYPSQARYIYVGGIIGKRGTAWFDDFRVTIDGKDIQTLEEVFMPILENIDTLKLQKKIAKYSNPFSLSYNDDFMYSNLDSLISKIGDKKIVAIGENTHGTSEFYHLRKIITKRLVKEKGFNLVVLESPYDDIELFNKKMSLESLDNLMKEHLFSIYQTKEMKSFLEWYKLNKAKYNIDFKGCDDSFWVFYEVLKDRIGSIQDKTLHKLLRELEVNLKKGITGNRKKEFKAHSDVYKNIVFIENHLKAINGLTSSIEELLFNGKNSYINYVNVTSGKPIQTRDEIMADRISYLAKNKKQKIVVWAHNAHISNKIITDGEIGIMGRDLKKEFGDNYHSIGLTTLKGSYSYIEERNINEDHSYNDEIKSARIISEKGLSWEKLFSKSDIDFYLDMSLLRQSLGTDMILGKTKLIGYGKEEDEDVYTLPLIQNFDTLFFIENTSSTNAINN